jgi:hypothetical protein
MTREQAIAHLEQVAADHKELATIMQGVATPQPIPDALPNAEPAYVPGGANNMGGAGSQPAKFG